ncbi:hypothetical protein Hdeb2414_s0008g00286621 [Helianthus debilis subsp. tardiflorus]
MMIILCVIVISVERNIVCCLDVQLRSCVFVFDDDNFMCCLDVLCVHVFFVLMIISCVIVISVERNIMRVLFFIFMYVT